MSDRAKHPQLMSLPLVGLIFNDGRIIFIEYNSIMTEVIVEQQLQLTNVVEIVQTRLTNNFTIVLKKINKNQQQFQLYAQQSQLSFAQTHLSIEKLQAQLTHQSEEHKSTIQVLNQRIVALELIQKKADEEAKQLPLNIKRLNDELFNTQLQFEEKTKNRDRQMEEIIEHLHTLALEQNRLNQEISNKENKVEAEKIFKETQILKDKNNHFQSQLKLATHKIEKMEILSQKAERLQAKKDIDFMRQIEERVKKELKVSLNAPGPRQSINQTRHFFQSQSDSSSNHSSPIAPQFTRTESVEVGLRSIPSMISQEQLLNTTNLCNESLVKSQVEHVVGKWGDKIKIFEVQLKQINENLKVLNRATTHKKTQFQNKENNDVIKDKVNEIKPELVKLWAKIDTIEDRLSFSERKTEEKLKGVNQLASLVKENSISRLDDKMKGLQTEIFTSLKEIKTKMEAKVNQCDYDKYRQQMEDKVSQINDLIYLKSDKLEVKKALLFLESKIKEIILVISEDQENEKDALLTKKQLKCISCDKELDKFSGIVSSPKGNWDSLPYKDHPPEILGRFGMTSFGSLAKKIKKLQSKDLPLLNRRGAANQSFQNS